MVLDHWLYGFNFNVEEWFAGDRYETLAICRNLAIARAVFKEAIAEKPARPVHDPQPHLTKRVRTFLASTHGLVTAASPRGREHFALGIRRFGFSS